MEIIQINENTWRVEDTGVRFFLLTGTKSALLIDSGMTVNAREIAEQLTNLPLALLNTHADPDHIGGNRGFDRFYMHPAEAANYYTLHRGTGELIPLAEGDILDLGERPLEIIAIPGHTPGSIAVLDSATGTLFSGDTVQDSSVFMFGPMREMHAYRLSLLHLMRYEGRFQQICPSHGTIPLEPSRIRMLYEATGRLEEFPTAETEVFGHTVRSVDTGLAVYLLDR